MDFLNDYMVVFTKEQLTCYAIFLISICYFGWQFLDESPPMP